MWIRWSLAVGTVTVALVGVLWHAPTALAQDEGGPPPLPIVYEGEVYVNGELLVEDAELTVRIGDWESTPVTVKDGQFLNLIGGPSSSAYVGQPITFHLGGMEADYRGAFALMGAPLSEKVVLHFGERGLATGTATVEPTEATVSPEPNTEATIAEEQLEPNAEATIAEEPLEPNAEATIAEEPLVSTVEPTPTVAFGDADGIGEDRVLQIPWGTIGILLLGGVVLLMVLNRAFGGWLRG